MKINCDLTPIKRVSWGLALLATTVLALLPQAYLQSAVFNWWDKAQHTLAFAVLTGWALWAWSPRGRAQTLKWGLAMVAYGAFIEVAQGLTGWRYAEWADLAADTLGVVGIIGVRSQLFGSSQVRIEN